MFLHGEAGDGLATQIWCCYQNVHKPLVLQSLLALFVEKMMFVLFKKGFNPLVTKKISESFHIWYSRHVSLHSDVVSWHSWKHYGPTTSTRPCNCKSHHLNSIEPFKGKIMAKKNHENSRSWSKFAGQNQCHATKKKQSHSPAGFKNHGANPENNLLIIMVIVIINGLT